MPADEYELAFNSVLNQLASNSIINVNEA